MRGLTLLFGLVAAAAAGAGASPAAGKRVAGRVMRVSSICGGGAAISREQLAQLPPPQPIGGKELLVVAGERVTASRPAARVVTRADGSFVTRLPPGTWCFFDAARKPPEPRNPSGTPPAPAAPPSATTDAGCLEEERRRCDLVLTVKGDVSDVEIRFINRCPEVWNQPCYRGPMPP